MTAITIHRIANGKLVEKWSEKDVLGLLTQIGVMRPPGQQGSLSLGRQEQLFLLPHRRKAGRRG